MSFEVGARGREMFKSGAWRVVNGMVTDSDDDGDNICEWCAGTGRRHAPEEHVVCGNCGLRWLEDMIDQADWTCRCGWSVVPEDDARDIIAFNIAWELAWRAEDRGDIPPRYDDACDMAEGFELAEKLHDTYVDTCRSMLTEVPGVVFDEIALMFGVKKLGPFYWAHPTDGWRGEFQF